MAACFVSAHRIMDTPHFLGNTIHGAWNRNDMYVRLCKNTLFKTTNDEILFKTKPTENHTLWGHMSLLRLDKGFCPFLGRQHHVTQRPSVNLYTPNLPIECPACQLLYHWHTSNKIWNLVMFKDYYWWTIHWVCFFSFFRIYCLLSYTCIVNIMADGNISQNQQSGSLKCTVILNGKKISKFLIFGGKW